MKRIQKQAYPPEFKERTVKRTDEVGSISLIAEKLGWLSRRCATRSRR